ncbi:hypothetical protein M8C21_020857 [Ambrosia artemisiifolia]|uniref:Mei2-like C-terminal RNA recognition motif domain-containing protein n=1 Tax=Ambrosia artemisiifolia TaxID=4212 RepID=A0AAD5GVN8_AMBAR|nr:hypothetical protein M8C21_020857 [Ambrosia artemisiifolia]
MSPSSLPGLASILHPQPARIAPIGKDHGNSMQDCNLTQLNGSMPTFGASSTTTSGIETLSSPQFLWGSPNRSSHGFPTTSQSPALVHPFTGQPSPFRGSSQQLHHVGSAPSGIPFDQHFGRYHKSPGTLFMSPPTFTGQSFLNSRGSVKNVSISGNFPENGSPNFSNISPRMSPMFLGLGSMNLDSMSERSRNHHIDQNVNQMDNKKQFQLDLDKIVKAEDTRTTLMIKNIPNKYTSKMLLASIDEKHSGTYDFLYLPIDFKNKCNVGYAFINMLSPMHIISFYQDFNGKKWEKFNSEKVASLAYARIQGKAALVTHFQDSSLMNEDKRCQPIIFHSEGSESVDQDHLPSSILSLKDYPYLGSPPDDAKC